MTSIVEIDTNLAWSLRKSGFAWTDIAEQLNSTVYLVRKALTAAGHRHWKRYQDAPKLLTVKQLARIKRIKAAGATWKELSRITGINPVILERYVNRH